MNIVAQIDEDTPKYMHLTAKTQYELAQGIDAAAQAAQLIEQSDSQLCYQICFEQLADQLLEEYQLDVPRLLNISQVNDKTNLQGALLKLVPLSATQWQLQAGESLQLANFQRDFKLLLARCLLDALDIMTAKGIWRFDIQRNVQQIQKRVFVSVDQYTFS